MSARYAIYYTPAPDSALWQLASAWFGRDSHTGLSVPHPANLDIAPVDLFEATDKPARYGFHATLVAPFELAPDRSETELIDRLATFCRDWSRFSVALKVDRLHDFIALVPTHPDARLDSLAQACVQDFDCFRAPMSQEDLARRDTPDLSDLERSLLKRWGYPHVLEAFRFHLSLTGPLSDAAIARLESKLIFLFADLLREPIGMGGLSLVKQPNRESPFCCLARRGFVQSSRGCPEK